MMNESQLIETVQSLEDYRATADALTELWEHKSKICEQLTLDILVEKRGDPQLQATAFNILYSVHKNQALSFAKTHLAQVHPYLLGTIIEQLAEEVAIVNENHNLREIVSKVSNFLDEKESSELELIKESVEWFKETFVGQNDDAMRNTQVQKIRNPKATLCQSRFITDSFPFSDSKKPLACFDGLSGYFNLSGYS